MAPTLQHPQKSKTHGPDETVSAIEDLPVVNNMVLDLLDEPSFIVDGDNVIIWANPPFAGTFDFKTEKVGKVTCEEVCASHLCGTKNCPVNKSARIGKTASGEFIRSSDGGVSYFLSKATPIKGEKKLTFVTLTDVTEKKSLEAKLRQLETDLNVIPTPIIEIDTMFTVTYMNPAGAAVVGLTPDEAKGRKCYDLFKTPHCKTEKCAWALGRPPAACTASTNQRSPPISRSSWTPN